MPAYVIGQLDIHDPEAYQEYLDRFLPSFQRHGGELLTVYGRVDKVTVKKGDYVKSGQKIGVVSDAAAPAEPRMHFEVRRGATVLDPMKFL